MPIVDGVFVPRGGLCAAEREVDWPAVYEHVTRRRAVVERGGAGAARRLAASVALVGGSPARAEHDLERALFAALAATVRYGFAEARRELIMLRARALVAYEVPDAGEHGQAAVQGLDTILAFVRRRARGAAGRVAAAVHAVTLADGWVLLGADDRLVLALEAARKSLRRNAVELVGEALNLGRSAGVQSLADPPRFALRSEQLDKATCGPCASVHGSIVQIGSGDYYQLMPPALCLGGGRCRGIYVYGDEPEQVRVAPRAA